MNPITPRFWLAIVAAALFSMLGSANRLVAQDSVYRMNVNLFDDSNVTAAGGAISITYELISGPAVPTLGGSFTMDFTWSSLSRDGDWWHEGAVVYSLPGRIGLEIDFASVLDNIQPLPPENTVSLSGGPIATFDEFVDEEQLIVLGGFSIAAGAVPVVEGYTSTDSVTFRRSIAAAFTGAEAPYTYYAAYWSRIEGDSSPLVTTHGQTINFDYLVMSNGDPGNNAIVEDIHFALGNVSEGIITFSAVPEPSSALLVGLVGMIALAGRSRQTGRSAI
jgi:hypothetical protein